MAASLPSVARHLSARLPMDGLLGCLVIAQTTVRAACRRGRLASDVDRCVGPDRLPKRQSSLAGHKRWVAALALRKWCWSWSRWRAWLVRSRTVGGLQPDEQPEKVGTLGPTEQGYAEACMGLGRLAQLAPE